jgi:hypothetical protein
MGKRGSKEKGAGDDAGKKGKRKGKPVGLATVLRPLFFGAAALCLVQAVLSKAL